jgi:hypothetical protein
MGQRINEIPPHYFPLMSLEDQALYRPSTAPDPTLDPHPPPKRNTAERKEQAQFANWLLLQNSNGKLIPWCWHATHKPSTASPGVPDFWVGVNARGLWIEFKRDYSCKLSEEQEEFRQKCEAQQIEMRVVYSAFEAIQLVQAAFSLFDLL